MKQEPEFILRDAHSIINQNTNMPKFFTSLGNFENNNTIQHTSNTPVDNNDRKFKEPFEQHADKSVQSTTEQVCSN